jgi:hypothetical protein
MAKPGARPGTGSVCARQEKAPPLLPLTIPMERDHRNPASAGEALPSIDERFCRRIRPGNYVFGRHTPASTNAFATESGPGDDVFGTHTGENLGWNPARAAIQNDPLPFIATTYAQHIKTSAVTPTTGTITTDPTISNGSAAMLTTFSPVSCRIRSIPRYSVSGVMCQQ